MTFSELNLHEDVLAGLDAMGFEKPTPIQEAAIPTIIANKDLIGCAQTGTGKTAAFLLPLMHKIAESGASDEHINTMIICPTRELAVQIDQQLEGLSYFSGITSLPVYGGGDGAGFTREKNALAKGTHIVIGTPGKLISHLNLGYVKVDQLKHLVLDEADRMLDMGFHEDIMKIINHLPKERQNLLFSATMAPKIRKMAKEILNDPEEINISIAKPSEKITQAAFLTYDSQKIDLVKHLLRFGDIPSLIVFTSRKSKVRDITRALQKEGFQAKGISSDLEQLERESILREFKNKQLPIIVATDVISRGIDVDNIDMIINYDVPNDAADYVHRIGRTARAESEGEAVTFINEDDQENFQKIEQLIEAEVRKVPMPDFLGEGPEYNPKKFAGRGRNSYGGKKKHFKKRR
ncbi:DEAD/DEAH box helicase [Roseivirga sp. E12]|uniref:DEAD/DEAH box helicase n=1 Tax=Roseivirga sp. E12 TaxID=2819237 RepID=UPI001ABBE5FD|nr:DEAD/DEAH box helicase [Roseivirga sp. E12]MBO3700577.1 DEAD/DEAH box helicase [Roseivirga sp. E12]